MASYLFPGLMYRRLKQAQEIYVGWRFQEPFSTDYHMPELLINAYQVYDLSLKQYFGLGAVLQYVPGTNANKARKQLADELEPAMEKMRKAIANPRRQQNLTYEATLILRLLRAGISSTLNAGIIFHLLFDWVSGFKSQGILRNNSYPFSRIAVALPILRGIFTWKNDKFALKDTPLINLFYSLLNPARIIGDTLLFLHLLCNRLLDIGTKPGTKSSFPKLILKGVIGLVFGVINLPIAMLKHLIDLPLIIVQVAIVAPIMHLMTSISESYQHRNESVVLATVEELRDVKELRQAAKERHVNYNAMSREESSREYIGTTKMRLYDYDQDSLQAIVAIRSSKDKMTATASLLSIVRFFAINKPETKAQDSLEAVAEAKKYYPPTY